MQTNGEDKQGETMQTNGEVLDAKQFLLVIKQAFKASGKPSITQWAEALGVSYQFLSHVMRGDYNPGPAMAKALGYEQIYGFRRKETLAKGSPLPKNGNSTFVGKYKPVRVGGYDPNKKVRQHGRKKAHTKKK